jgi:hypothetical protein
LPKRTDCGIFPPILKSTIRIEPGMPKIVTTASGILSSSIAADQIKIINVIVGITTLSDTSLVE